VRPYQGLATLRYRFRSPGSPRVKVVWAGDDNGSAKGRPRGRLAQCEVKRFGMGPAVMLSQDLTGVARTVGDGAVADLAAGDRKLGNGHREAAGR
jgi:hypothetical protein